ncbi:MAG TPA: sugar transferase [Planctomycetaceae bacterium]|nr:sugar transferase [Planctomycetaceae bacterium]
MMFMKLRHWWKPESAERSGHAPARLHATGPFRDLLDRERNRSDRSGAPFALVVFGFAAEQDPKRFRLAGRLEQRLRAVDDAGWLDGERIGVILTNTPHAGARTFIDNILHVGGEPIPCGFEVYVYPGCGESDPQHRGGRRHGTADRHPAHAQPAAGLPQPSYTAVSERAVSLTSEVEQRLASTVDLMQALCDGSASVAGGDAPVQSLDRLFARPLPAWKRALDVVGAIVACVLFAPVMLAAAGLVKLTSRGPILFRQTRVGLGGRHFTMYKFRTMCVDAEARQAELRPYNEQDGPAFKLANDPRVTRVGRYLRKACIDELPQLWNVLRGDMTLVGPRPLDPAETSRIAGWQRRRIDGTPGLTCIWQLHGKSRVPFAEWMRMDIRYLRSRSPVRDLRLIVQTVLAVVLHRGSG